MAQELKAIDDLYERRIRNGSDPYKIKLVDVRHPPVYLKSEADAVLAEKDKEIERLDDLAHAHNVELLRKENLIAEKDAEIRRLQRCEIWMKQHFYCEEVIACESAKNRRLKRALWLARAERADDRARIFYFNDLESLLDIDGFSYDSKKKKDHKKSTARDWRITWLKVERKCRAKAEEYK